MGQTNHSLCVLLHKIKTLHFSLSNGNKESLLNIGQIMLQQYSNVVSTRSIRKDEHIEQNQNLAFLGSSK